jgi:hypothetical protein
MSAAGFETTIPASERPHTNALDRAATGIVIFLVLGMFHPFLQATKALRESRVIALLCF